MNLTAAIYQRLANDPTLVDLIADHGSIPNLPAIYTDDRIEGNPPMPYVWTHGEVANEEWDTKTSQGERPTRDIIAYDGHRQTRRVEGIARRIRDLFHRHPLEVEGYRTVTARCQGPVRLSSDEYDARIVTVRFRLARDPNHVPDYGATE